ncbi:MAG: capsule assembly Wzi family protein [Gemmatimonadota bacterium]|nr:capsule assembly Wzi family protein [Gemmatimonadota bacterium]
MDAAPPQLDRSGHPWADRLGAAFMRRDDRSDTGVRTPWSLDGGWTEARARVWANTGHPFGGNDGVAWQGKGLTTALDLGAWARWGWLSVRAQPTVTVSQNAAFDLAPETPSGMPEVAYPWRRIDMPQRFGDGTVTTVHPGDSEIRLDARGVTLGLSSRNLWWGPGIHHSILMSDNAPGIVHGFLGTRSPVDIWIGDLEAQWVWGRLGQSDHYDPSVEDTDRFLTGLALTYQPAFVEGLHLGATRMFYGYVPEGGPELGDFFLVLQGVRKEGLATPDNPQGNDREDQMLSLFMRWVFPESGLELYGEWARNDHSWNFRDYFMEPEHSQGYVLGLRKATSLEDGRRLAVGAEMINLQRGRTTEVRPTPVFYAHHIVRQGYTNEGQAIGSNVGPGGNAQVITTELYEDWGRARLLLERRIHDNDAYYAFAEANDLDFCCHHVGLSAGLEALVFAGPFDLGGGLTLTRELNRYFDRGNDVWNVNLSLSARWRPR